MSFIKKNNRVFLWCPRTSSSIYWKEQFAQAGIAMDDYSVETGTRNLTSQSILLVNDLPFEWFADNANRFLFEKWTLLAKHVYVLSSDENWSTVGRMMNCTILPATTHPLELARLLVEKHMIVPVNKSTSYAFPFFQL